MKIGPKQRRVFHAVLSLMKQDLAVACQVLTSSEKVEAGGQERRTRQLLQRLAHIRLKGCVFLAMRDTHNLSTVLYETPSMSFLFVRQNGRAAKGDLHMCSYILRRNCNFVATSKPPATMRKVHYGLIDMSVHKYK